jgi:hypothetical protein
MKQVLTLVAAAGIIAASSAAFGATIVQSKHDLALGHGASYASGSAQICVYCHAPHNAANSLPLWNRSNPTITFTLYSGLNMQNVSFQSGFTSDSTSLFCMSCHDGNTNIGAVHNAGAIDGQTAGADQTHAAKTGMMAQGAISGSSANLGQNLSKTHPINFPVGTANTLQNDLWVGTAAHMGPSTNPINGSLGYTFGKTFPLFRTQVAGSAARSTTNRSLECGSCHAVHDSEFSPFLRAYGCAGSNPQEVPTGKPVGTLL